MDVHSATCLYCLILRDSLLYPALYGYRINAAVPLGTMGGSTEQWNPCFQPEQENSEEEITDLCGLAIKSEHLSWTEIGQEVDVSWTTAVCDSGSP